MSFNHNFQQFTETKSRESQQIIAYKHWKQQNINQEEEKEECDFTSAVKVTISDLDSVDDEIPYIFAFHTPNAQANHRHFEATAQSNRHFFKSSLPFLCSSQLTRLSVSTKMGAPLLIRKILYVLVWAV